MIAIQELILLKYLLFFFDLLFLQDRVIAIQPFHPVGTQFCLLYWYRSTNTDAEGAARCSVCLLYWYKSTNTDAEGAAANYLLRLCRRRGEQKQIPYERDASPSFYYYACVLILLYMCPQIA